MPGRTGHYQWARRIAQIFTARPRLCAGLVAGLIAAVLLPAGSRGTMRAILAWDVGVLVYLLLSAMLFTTERIDLMFLDLTMPEVDGYQVLKTLQEAGRTPPTIVVSADIQPIAQQRVRQLGAMAFVKKSLSQTDLASVLQGAGLL